MTNAAGDSAGRVPRYWMQETSGVLRPSIEAYLTRAAMTNEQIVAMRAYLRRWIMASCWDANPDASRVYRQRVALLRRWVDSLTSREVIKGWLDMAVAIGIDPL